MEGSSGPAAAAPHAGETPPAFHVKTEKQTPLMASRLFLKTSYIRFYVTGICSSCKRLLVVQEYDFSPLNSSFVDGTYSYLIIRLHTN